MNRFLCMFLLAAACFLVPSTGDAAAFRLGDQGDAVMDIQRALAEAGYDITADGEFGPATEAALRSYQEANGMEVDGLAGPAVYSALLGREFPEVSRGYMGSNRRLIATAMQYLGVPYVYGGSSPSGFDCSGFVQYVYRQCGIDLPRTADIQAEVGIPVDKSELQPGDLVFFAGDYVNISHVGIYLQDGQFIHASTTYGIAFDSLYRDYRVEHYAGARRIL
ncbi:MAG: C40 family peptidase [Selenomonadaceae bacterium]|nr:C40 family peptidase [Selenomonadaceae bacterium]